MSQFLDFNTLTPARIPDLINQHIQAAQAALEQVCHPSFPVTWHSIHLKLETAVERLSVLWGAISHLNSVADTPEQRAAYNDVLPKVTEFFTHLGFDERLYAQYKKIDPLTLNAEQLQAYKNTLRHFRLGGADLTGEKKERYAQIGQELSALAQKFSENVLDSTQAFLHIASKEDMAGIPNDVKLAAHALAKTLKDKNLEEDSYALTLKAPCYFPVMQFAHSSALREILYKAYVTRASDQSNSSFDNSSIMQKLLALKHEEAQLLGFSHYAELSLTTKMAQSSQQVIDFLQDLAQHAKPYAIEEIAAMREFANTHLGIHQPQPWDWSFIAEQLRQAQYAYSESEVKNYFQLPRVLTGLFQTIETLFDVQIALDDAGSQQLWHNSVQLYCVMRQNKLLAQFYLDTTARDGKREGAWMDGARDRWLRPDTQKIQLPIAHLVCNFGAGIDGKPSLLTHDDVITLFHEFGHGLHHMLTQVNERDVSGINGVEWDAVELPSQFMENFCWQWDVVQSMSAHIDTGAPISRALFDKMLAAKNFQTGLQTMRQIEFALFDMQLHSQPHAVTDIMGVLARVKAETAVLPSPEYNRPPHSFSHIFAGGYAAGYYSYKWAEVLSADCYAAFEEASAPDLKTVGQKFLSEILQKGGSRPALESFVAFRGRTPKIDALLRHQGLIKT